jgi:hypothetical protein
MVMGKVMVMVTVTVTGEDNPPLNFDNRKRNLSCCQSPNSRGRISST